MQVCALTANALMCARANARAREQAIQDMRAAYRLIASMSNTRRAVVVRQHALRAAWCAFTNCCVSVCASACADIAWMHSRSDLSFLRRPECVRALARSHAAAVGIATAAAVRTSMQSEASALWGGSDVAPPRINRHMYIAEECACDRVQ